MKKRNVTALSEILSNDVNVGANLVEDMQQFTFNKVLGIPSGLVFGLAVSANGPSGFTIASGALIDSTNAYGELEATSGVSLTTVPISGTRTDTISARYLEVADSPGASYNIIDIESRTQTTENVYRRKFGSVQIEVFENTASGALTGNRQAIASVSVTSGGISVITDLRTFVKPQKLDTTAVNIAGDVIGPLSASVVGKIQGFTFAATTPTSGQVYVYGTQFDPVTPGGDISGWFGNLSVNKLKGMLLDASAAASGKVIAVDAAGTGLEFVAQSGGGSSNATKMTAPTVTALTPSGTVATDASLGNFFSWTAAQNFTLQNPTGASDGQKIEWRIRQDATGSRTITFDTKFRFGTTIPSITLTTTANKTDRIGVEYHAADDKFDVIAFSAGH